MLAGLDDVFSARPIFGHELVGLVDLHRRCLLRSPAWKARREPGEFRLLAGDKRPAEAFFLSGETAAGTATQQHAGLRKSSVISWTTYTGLKASSVSVIFSGNAAAAMRCELA